MSATPAMVSIGDDGVLNREVSQPLSDVWLDRDLGWLDFNDRVLAEALDERTPLLEKAKFLAIFTSNLDEFMMKRVAVLRTASTPERVQLLRNVRERLLLSLERQAECFRDTIVPELASHGIHLRKWDDLTAAQQEEAGRYFDAEISPALTPLVFDPVSSVSLPFESVDVAGLSPEGSNDRRDLLRPCQGSVRTQAMDRAGSGCASRAKGFRVASRGDSGQCPQALQRDEAHRDHAVPLDARCRGGDRRRIRRRALRESGQGAGQAAPLRTRSEA